MGAQLSGAQWSGAQLSGAQLCGGSTVGAQLSGPNGRGSTIRTQLSGAQLSGAQLSGHLAEDDIEATNTLNDITQIAQTFGLQINVEKTKILSKGGSPAYARLNGVQIEHVTKFKYLGSLIHEKKIASTTENNSRIGQAAATFASLKWCLWKTINISTKTKIRLFRILILPILLYGSETWTLLKPELNKLEGYQMRCLRQILRISLRDHIRNEIIRNRCEHQPTIEELIQKRRMRWFGHVCRMNNNRLPQTSL